MSPSTPQQEFIAAMDAHKGIIYKIAIFYCKDKELRKDLVQEILFQLWKSYPTYNSQYKLSTWIYRVALNVSISFYGKEKKRTAFSSHVPAEILSLPYITEPGEIENDIEVLEKLLSGIKELDKALVILYLEGNDHKEIAGILGISATNVSTRLNRVKEQLKQKAELLKIKRYE